MTSKAIQLRCKNYVSCNSGVALSCYQLLTACNSTSVNGFKFSRAMKRLMAQRSASCHVWY